MWCMIHSKELKAKVPLLNTKPKAMSLYRNIVDHMLVKHSDM